MQFLSLSRRRTDTFPPEAFTPERIAAEGARVKEMYAAGIVRQIWARADAGGAAETEDEAAEPAPVEDEKPKKGRGGPPKK